MKCSSSELDKLIKSKKAELKRLNREYNALLKSRSYIPKETEALNSELYNLMAEVNHLKKSEPEIMPKHDSFLYGWVHKSLEEDIKQEEKILSNLDKMHEESSKKRDSLIRRRPSIASKNINKKMLDEARSKNELLHCLHRKMVRRLRRLSRRFSTLNEQSEECSTSTRDMSGKVLTRSFYRVLKEFVVELQDRTFQSDNWDDLEPVIIDETYPKEHIGILCKANIIKKITKHPSCYYLTTKNSPPKRLTDND